MQNRIETDQSLIQRIESLERTNRRMIDDMANHGNRIRNYMDRHVVEEVENFIDCCLSVEDLIDIYSPHIRRKEPVDHEVPEVVGEHGPAPVVGLRAGRVRGVDVDRRRREIAAAALRHGTGEQVDAQGRDSRPVVRGPGAQPRVDLADHTQDVRRRVLLVRVGGGADPEGRRGAGRGNLR